MKIQRYPPLIPNLIHAALHACEGARFHAGTVCPDCGGSLSGYDSRKKRFAVLTEGDDQVVVHVITQRSYCSSCEKIVNPPEPFYPGTRIGSPVVDLCRILAREFPYNRVSQHLSRLGVVADRWSVRNYAMAPLPDIPAMDIFGMKVPVSILTLSGSLSGSGHPDMDEILAACRYPSQVPRLPLASLQPGGEL